MNRSHVWAGLAALAVAAALVASPETVGASAPERRATKLNAIVASFDPHVGADQRFIVGLVANNGRQLAFGTVEFRFAFAGTRSKPQKRVTSGPAMPAEYRPLPGQDLNETDTSPRLVRPSTARGVYGAAPVRFDRPGLWAVLVQGRVKRQKFRAQAVFDVAERPRVPAPGEAAPRIANPLPGTPGVPPTAIDSRASEGRLPDLELHRTSIPEALAAGRPLMVVVSTPVYCVSQFCGPITDAVQQLAVQYGDRMAFVHLEVWRDFAKHQLNNAASAWISPRDGSDGHEPWVFVVNREGSIAERFDNVATDNELRQAIEAQLATR